MKYDVITVGGATEDMTLFTHEGILIDNKHDVLRQELLGFEYGAKLLVDRAETAFGGGAANAAISLARLGLKVASISAVGDDDRGKKIIKHFKKEKIDIKLVQVVKNQMSGFSPIIVGPENEHISFSVRGANTDLSINSKIVKNLKKTNWVYLTSLSGDWKTILSKLFEHITAKVVWNPGHIQLSAGKKALGKYLKKTEILIINHDEARELVLSDAIYSRKPLSFFDNVGELAKIIASWGPKVVVITQGAKGASALHDGQISNVKAVKLKQRVNTVGVGDAFGSSLLAGIVIYNGDIKRALQLAAYNAASVASKDGAQTGLINKIELSKLSI